MGLGRRIRGAVSGVGGGRGRRSAAGGLGLAGLGDAPGAGLFAYGSVCSGAGAVGAVVPERWGSADDLVCRRLPINSFLKFNLHLIFRGKIFEQKLDIMFPKL